VSVTECIKTKETHCMQMWLVITRIHGNVWTYIASVLLHDCY